MNCRPTIILKGKNYPFFQETAAGHCDYRVLADNETEMSKLIVDAKAQNGYVEHSESFDYDGKIAVYITFKKVQIG